MKPRYAVLAIGTLLLSSALVRAADKLDQVAAAKGKVIYERYCASCHGVQGRGDGPMAGVLRVAPTDLTRLGEGSMGGFSVDALARSIDGRRTVRAHGTPDMPVWGDIFPRTQGTDSPSVDSAVYRIVHYVGSLQAKKK